MARTKKTRTPVTLVTGYLGSGKTTFVNRLLEMAAQASAAPARRIAVIVNEFGSVGIDGALLADNGNSEKVIELANGCLCCVVVGEFRDTLEKLDASSFDAIVIETSGAADPTAVIRMFWGAPELTDRYRLDGVVCLADSRAFFMAAGADPVAALQASVADVVVISKVDSASPEQVSALHNELQALNPVAEIIEADCTKAEAIALEAVFDLDAYRKPRPRFLARLQVSNAIEHNGLTSFAMEWHGEVAPEKLQAFFRNLVLGDSKVVRTKALIKVAGEKRPWLIQGVQSWIERNAAPKNYDGPNKLVVLGRGLDKLQLEQAIDELRQPAIS